MRKIRTLTKKSLDELEKVMPRISELSQRRYIGGSTSGHHDCYSSSCTSDLNFVSGHADGTCNVTGQDQSYVIDEIIITGTYSVHTSSSSFAVKNTPHTMIPQKTEWTCVTSSMEYVYSLFGGDNAEGKRDEYYNYIEKEFGIDPRFIAKTIAKYFGDPVFFGYKRAIDQGHVVMTNILVDGPDGKLIGHNVVVVGYQSNGNLIYMDPGDGKLYTSSSDSIGTSHDWKYNIQISGNTP